MDPSMGLNMSSEPAVCWLFAEVFFQFASKLLSPPVDPFPAKSTPQKNPGEIRKFHPQDGSVGRTVYLPTTLP